MTLSSINLREKKTEIFKTNEIKTNQRSQPYWIQVIKFNAFKKSQRANVQKKFWTNPKRPSPCRNLVNEHCCSVIPYVCLLIVAFYNQLGLRRIARIFEGLFNTTFKDVDGSINQCHFSQGSRHCQAGYQLPFICRYVVNFTAIQKVMENIGSSSNENLFVIFTDTTCTARTIKLKLA